MKKSLPVLAGSMRVSKASRTLLSTHFDELRTHVEAILESKGEGVEPIHQLRVSTRRLAAVLRTFSDCFPDRSVTKLKKRLRKLRRKASAVRFGDVLILDLTRRYEKSSGNGTDVASYALEWVTRERKNALEPLLKATHKLQTSDLWDWVAKRFLTKRAAKSCKRERLQDRSRPEVAKVLRRLQRAHAIWQKDQDWVKLHQCRVDLKHFRYTLEIFAGCFRGPKLVELDSAVQALQKSLGDVNDSREFAEALRSLASETKNPDLEKTARGLADTYVALVDEQMRDFRRNWGVNLPVVLASRTREMFESAQLAIESSQ